MIPFNNVKVILTGFHELKDEILKVSSTVTLIKSDKNILVDTGGFGQEKQIIANLKKEGLNPENIDIVLLTHLHLDHTINMHFFPRAKIYCKFINGAYPGQYHDPSTGTLGRMELKDGSYIAKDVAVLELPGHTYDLIGLLVETDQGRVVIAGDCIASEKFADMKNKPEAMLLWDMKEYNQSRERVLKLADFVVPGHGAMFQVKKEF